MRKKWLQERSCDTSSAKFFFHFYIIFISNHTIFLVQFGINLHVLVLKKLKLNSPKRLVQFQLFEKFARANLFQIEQETPYDYLLTIQAWKNSHGESAGRCSLEAIFSQSFCTKFLSLLNMRSLAYKISHCLSVNHNQELRCVTCTGVTLFALVLHLNCFALSQLESSNLFMCITIRLCIQNNTYLHRGKAGKEQIHQQWADLSYTSLTYFNSFCLMKLIISRAFK